MSTTNPDSGQPPADPVGGLAPVSPDAPRADDHAPSGPPDPATIARGHEVDRYDNASVMSVPLLVLLFFVLAFGTTTIIFYFIAPKTVDPNAHPQAAERNNAPLNERIARTQRGKEVDQPRLEGVKQRSGDARAITRPELPTGNSPWIQADDLRPSPTNTPALYRSGWADQNKTVARLTIDEAMELAVSNQQLNVLKVSATPSTVRSSANVPTAANAGRGFGPSEAAPPKLPPAPNGGKK
jgi:hypothetical protein